MVKIITILCMESQTHTFTLGAYESCNGVELGPDGVQDPSTTFEDALDMLNPGDARRGGSNPNLTVYKEESTPLAHVAVQSEVVVQA